MKYLKPAVALLATICMVGSAAAREPNVIKRVFLDQDERRIGTLWIMNNPDGPDMANMKFRRLPPEELFTVHLAESAQVGSVPTVFVGHFRSTAEGTGQFDIQMELFNSYVGVNQKLENELGIGRSNELGIRPGAVDNDGKTVPLIYFRVYSVSSSSTVPNGSIFGLNADSVGGGHVASTDRAFGCCAINTVP